MEYDAPQDNVPTDNLQPAWSVSSAGPSSPVLDIRYDQTNRVWGVSEAHQNNPYAIAHAEIVHYDVNGLLTAFAKVRFFTESADQSGVIGSNYFDPNGVASNAFDLDHIMQHELGHAFGLGDTNQSTTSASSWLMYNTVVEGPINTPSNLNGVEVDALEYIYPF